MSSKVKFVLLYHIKIILVVVLYYLILHILDWTCLIRGITKIPCPVCGSTRAILSLLKFDLNGYMFYNPVALLIAGVLIMGFYRTFLIKFINKYLFDFIFYIVLLIIMITYIYRMIYGIIP